MASLVDTSLCNADYIVYLSTTDSVGRYVTIKDTGSNPSFFTTSSIIISTTSGYSFLDGGKEFIRRPGDSLTFATMSSNWRLMNTLAYTPAGRTVLCNVSTTHMYTSTFSNAGGPFRITNVLSTGKIDTQQQISVQDDLIVNQPNLTSTFVGLGTLGIISSHEAVNSNLLSSSLGLATIYISTQHLQSTIVGLGSLSYVSTSWLTSTFQGLGPLYISIPQLTSTVAGLGPTYISTASHISTVQGLGQTYVSIPQLVSTVSDLFSKTTSNHQSTFSQLGLLYISSTSLVSTVTGLSNIGSSNNYILASNFNSTFTGIGITDLSNSTSTIAGLATVGYISYTQLQSTVSNVFVINQSNVAQTLSSLGSLYVSAPSLQSTVAGLGSAAGAYISTVQLVSTTNGVEAPTRLSLISTVTGLGQLYVSTSGLISTTAGLCNAALAMITSSINGMGSIYISSTSLQSTVAGLAPPYIATSQLTSTTDGVNRPMFSTNAGLGSLYLSSLSLFSSIGGLSAAPYRYISTNQLTSTTTGIKTSAYISVLTLTSTTTGLSNFSMTPMVSTVQGFGQTYLSTSIPPDGYVVSTLPIPAPPRSYMGVPITVFGNVLYFASETTIYSYNLTTSANTQIATGFGTIKGITASATYLYVTDQNQFKQIRISDATTTVIANSINFAGYEDGNGIDSVKFDNPNGLVVDSSDSNLYVADTLNNKIRRIQISPLSVRTIASFNNPIGITIDSENKYLYVTNSTSIYKVSIFNKISSNESSVSVLTASSYCYGICSEPSNKYLYITNPVDHYINLQQLSPLFSSNAAGSGSSGNKDGIGSLASFSEPRGICFNPADLCLYSIDAASRLIRRTTTQFYQSTINGLGLVATASTQTQRATLTSPTANRFITGIQQYSLPVAGSVLWLDGADPLNTGIAPANGTLTNWVDKAGRTTARTGTLTYTNGEVGFNNSYITTNLSAVPTNKTMFAVFKPSLVSGGSLLGATGQALQLMIQGNNVQIEAGAQMLTTYYNDTTYLEYLNGIGVGASGKVYWTSDEGNTEYGLYSYSLSQGTRRIIYFTNGKGIFIDSQEEFVYVAAGINILKVNIEAGTSITLANAGIVNPTAVCVIGTRVYIADEGQNRVKYINTTDTNQTASVLFDVYSYSGAPVGICTDGTYLFVSWYTNITSTIRAYVSKHEAGGALLNTVDMAVVTGLTYSGNTGKPGGLCMGPLGTLFVAMPGANVSAVYVIYADFSGGALYAGDRGVRGYSDGIQTATSLTFLHSPQSVAFDPSGLLYIADTGNNKIRKLSSITARAPISINTSYVFSTKIRTGVINGVSLNLNQLQKDVGSFPNIYLTSADYRIGANSSGANFYNGTISEVIIYDSALSDTDRAAVETYLTNKWTNYVTGPTTTALSITTQLTSTQPITANIMTAATFKAMNGRSGGPNYGFYTGDATYVNSISDRRLKENIQTITFPLEKVKALQAVQYRMTSDPSRRWIGYIAQDVEPILPEIVRTDSNGWKSIQYTQLPGLAIEAVKELYAKYAHIESLLSTVRHA